MSRSKQKVVDVAVRAINKDGMECIQFVPVKAQYHRIVDGALVFRNFVPNGYPQMVRTFAAGHWLEIIGDA